jgi:hypothetical protein
MKRIGLSLFVLVAVTVAQFGVQTTVEANADETITFDVAIDCRTWRNNLGISFDDMARGDSFIANGKIFPAGTLPSGTATNDPNGRGSIGAWIERGTMAATLAEIVAGKRPAFFATWFHMLDDGRGLVADGPHPDSGPMAVIGGTGGFSGASGEISEVTIIGTNSTGCPNMRLIINLKKQAPK